MKYACTRCSTEFNARPSDERKFCSYKCYWAEQKEDEKYHQKKSGVYLKCVYCKKEYYVAKCRKDISKYCSQSCSAKDRNPVTYRMAPYPTGKDAYRWKGGQTINTQGYVLIRNTDHPHADTNGYVREHRLVLEKDLGRYLELNEVVHHRNGNKKDNRLENLEILSRAEHLKLHPEIPDKAHKGMIGKPPPPHKTRCKCFRCAKITRSLSL